MTGTGPHKAPHTAVAVSGAEEPLGELRVRASGAQAGRLPEWAAAWPERTWAAGAGGLGHLPARQLPAAGERVPGVQPKLAARVRLPAAGNVNENDPDDARPVAVAALRSPGVREARPDDHAAVLKVRAERHRDLGSARTQVVCRLHAVLCELIPGGVGKKIIAAHAARLLDSVAPPDAVAAAHRELAAALIEDLRRIDARLRDTKKKPGIAVRASGTSLTGLFGVGPVIAAAILGEVRDAPASLPTTEPRPSRSPPASGRSTGCPGAGTGGSTTPSTWPPSPRSASRTAGAAPATTGNWPRARPAGKPCGR